ncbi:MAG: VWA domain-containing protein [Propionibacteriaceae bacterium]|jgi:Ca-activated chloride channel family protein|nr:VWA domain-containing protein [Propionibacteriaceae bacterium]
MIPDGFLYPERLWWLLLVPAFLLLYVGILAVRRSRQGKRQPSRLERVLPKQQGWKRLLALICALLSMAALNIAYAMPSGEVEVPRERATIVLAIDVSRSMLAEDVSPDRLQAAQSAAHEFINLLPTSFNVALVSFAGTSTVVVPPTVDRGVVGAAIDNLSVSPATAIGDGIYSSLDALVMAPKDPNHPDDPAPGAIVLLSDGYTNVGKDSAGAAKKAKEDGYQIYTIAFGTPNGCVDNDGICEPVPVDHSELQRIADISGGRKFEAASAGELKEVYANIAQSIGYVKVQQEVTERFAGYALGLAVLAAIAMASLAARWP